MRRAICSCSSITVTRWCASEATLRTGCDGCCTTSTRLADPRRRAGPKLWLDRVARPLAREERTIVVRSARDLVRRCRTLTCDGNELERETAAGVAGYAPQLLQLKAAAR